VHQKTLYRFSSEIQEKIATLRVLDNWHCLLDAFEDVAMIGSAITLGFYFPILYPIAIFVIGSRMRGLATLVHESAHQVLAKSSLLNNVLGIVAGYLILQVPEVYKRSHVGERITLSDGHREFSGHHLKLGDPVHDPDIRFHIELGLYDKMTARQFVWKYIVSSLLFLRVTAVLRYLFRDRLLGPAKQLEDKVIREQFMGLLFFWAILILTFFTCGTFTQLVLFWFIPFLTTFPLVNSFCELSEHYPLLAYETSSLRMTRNRLGKPIENFFFGIHDENWHLEHHLNPAIPHWNLAKSREIRLADPKYAELDKEFGGIFLPGPKGGKSAVAKMIEYHSTNE